MSALTIERTLHIAAPVPLAWKYLVSPSLIVGCLPGATLTSSSEDGSTHEGAIKVKLGALTVAYSGSARFVEVDQDAHTMRLEAKGREKTGSGQVSMEMAGRVAPHEEGSAISIRADVTLAGKIVSMGRGMIELVAEQMLDEFAACLARTLAAETSDPAPTGLQPEAAEAVEGFALLFRALKAWLRRALGRGR